MLSRDADSRVNSREASAVREWLESDADFHLMRDHPEGHWDSIMAGMFGARNGVLIPFKNDFARADKKLGAYLCDQDFLREAVYPSIRASAFVHDEHWGREPQHKAFPKREGNHVGFIDCHSYAKTETLLGKEKFGSERDQREE